MVAQGLLDHTYDLKTLWSCGVSQTLYTIWNYPEDF
jgi:hypothetical protein